MRDACYVMIFMLSFHVMKGFQRFGSEFYVKTFPKLPLTQHASRFTYHSIR